jgi:type IV pilus assembly protein PilB
MHQKIDGNNIEITLKEGTQFNYEYIIHNRVIKLYQDDKKVIIGKDDSVSKEHLNELKHTFRKYNVEFTSLTQKEFDGVLRLAGKDHNVAGESKKVDNNNEDLTKLASDAPIVNLVNEIILSAVDKKASDIHFEAFENHFRVRFRLNGRLEMTGTYAKSMFDAVCARIKVISKLDITQRRLAQDGKALLNLYDKKIDIRTSTLPTIYGESIVLRLLGIEDNLNNLESLGFIGEDINVLKRIIDKSYGAFILTGPTGSGKTTTLRSLLNMLDKKTKNIITVEDPVEYTIDGINQVQINDKIDFGFGTILRNLLRQDPDVIMIGEMRDMETADIALRSAMTGHLVLSTLHTNDAVSSITRLINMGVEPYVIESSIIAAAAQRLVRVLCPECKIEMKIEDTHKELLKRYGMVPAKLYRPVGCPKCNHTGFKGRTGVFEVFELDDSIREMIVERDSISVIRKKLKNDGFITLFEKGLKKANEGEVFIDEVKSVIGEAK